MLRASLSGSAVLITAFPTRPYQLYWFTVEFRAVQTEWRGEGLQAGLLSS